MAHDAALAVVNDLKAQLASLARAIVLTQSDGVLSLHEGLALGRRGVAFASAVVTLLQGRTPEERQAVLWLLEHAVVSVPEEPA